MKRSCRTFRHITAARNLLEKIWRREGGGETGDGARGEGARGRLWAVRQGDREKKEQIDRMEFNHPVAPSPRLSSLCVSVILWQIY
jgi:hypothetical protein